MARARSRYVRQPARFLSGVDAIPLGWQPTVRNDPATVLSIEEMSDNVTGPIFLVVDFQRESRFLLVKTLQRKFPRATVRECEDAEQAVQMARTQDIACIVTHRTFETSGADLVRQLREVDPGVPIVMVSGIDRAKAALDAGATSFLSYDEWLRIGTIVEQHMATREAEEENEGEADCVA